MTDRFALREYHRLTGRVPFPAAAARPWPPGLCRPTHGPPVATVAARRRALRAAARAQRWCDHARRPKTEQLLQALREAALSARRGAACVCLGRPSCAAGHARQRHRRQPHDAGAGPALCRRLQPPPRPRGTLWDGRFRSALIEAGPHAAGAAELDAACGRRRPTACGGQSSLRPPHGRPARPALIDPPACTGAGQHALRARAALPPAAGRRPGGRPRRGAAAAVHKGWAWAIAAFLAALAEAADRPSPVQPRPRRPLDAARGLIGSPARVLRCIAFWLHARHIDLSPFNGASLWCAGF
jgi:hypothetical protein